MKHLKTLTLISWMFLMLNCKTSPPLLYQESKQDQIYLVTQGSESSAINAEHVDAGQGQTSYTDMDEETFINFLNKNFDKLSRLEGIWSNDKNTFKIGIQRAGEPGKYFAFILSSQEPNMKKGEIIAEFIETRYGDVYSTSYYLEDQGTLETKSYISGQGKLELILFLIKVNKKNITFLKTFPEITH